MMVKVCPTCGKRFEADDDELVYCSVECFVKRNKKPSSRTEYDKLAYEKRVREKKERAAAERLRARLAKRDAEYAAHAPKVTVDCVKTTDGRTLVVETRGQPCIGFRAVGLVKHC